MKKHGVEVRKGQRGDHRHAGMVESFNRWLAERLFKAMRARARQEGKDDDLRWTYLLQPMVAAFNSEETRLLGMTPQEAMKRQHVPQPEEPKVKSLRRRKILAIDTPVRVLLPEPDEKGRFRSTDPQWSKKVYKIEEWRFNGTFHPIEYKTTASWSVRHCCRKRTLKQRNRESDT